MRNQSNTVTTHHHTPSTRHRIHHHHIHHDTTKQKVYDAVDLDPYGTPAHLLDSAVQAVSEGGLLMVTATDMAVLCGNSGEVCWTKYGSYPVHRPYCHEGAVRILLACIEQHAARYKRHITPLVSLSIDFYVRVFVRVHTSAGAAKHTASRLAYYYQSQGCDSWVLQRVGEVSPGGRRGERGGDEEERLKGWGVGSGRVVVRGTHDSFPVSPSKRRPLNPPF